MTPEDTKSWNKLFNMLDLIRQYSIKICIHRVDRIYITIDSLEHSPSFCHQCKIVSDSFYMTGHMWDFTENRLKVENLKYSCNVVQWAYHECDNKLLATDSTSDTDFFATFKFDLDLDRSPYVYWHLCPDISDIISQTISKVHIIQNIS